MVDSREVLLELYTVGTRLPTGPPLRLANALSPFPSARSPRTLQWGCTTLNRLVAARYNSRLKAMDYFKAILSGIAAIFIAESAASWSIMFRGISEQKATGLGAVAGGLVEGIFSPRFWLLAVLFFALFFAGSRLGNKFLRIFLFWIPTLLVSTLGIAILALFAYALIHLKHLSNA
jgi:hypothetical protein